MKFKSGYYIFGYWYHTEESPIPSLDNGWHWHQKEFWMNAENAEWFCNINNPLIIAQIIPYKYFKKPILVFSREHKRK
jgi:hypothetical protein